MKITLFSSNHPRHLHLAKLLAAAADEVYFIQECTTIHTGEVADFYQKSEVMQSYFSKVIAAERKIFGPISFLPPNVRALALKMHDLRLLKRDGLEEALHSDLYVVFGASYIRGWLVDFLVERKAVNIHMGLSPYYRGSSCNFWAMYDGNFGHVGATVHFLTKGLDSGPMLFHCLPNRCVGDTPFDFSMRAVLAAHNGLSQALQSKPFIDMAAVPQSTDDEIRYTRNADFEENVAAEFLARDINVAHVPIQYPKLLRPYIQS